MPPTNPSDQLRLVLRANAAFSLVGGAIALVAGGWTSEQLGIDHLLITRLLGAGLIIFAIDVFVVSRRPEPKLLVEAALVSAADFGWVLGTVVVLALGILSTAGVIVAAIIGVAVADFGIAQLWFRSKVLGRERTATLAV